MVQKATETASLKRGDVVRLHNWHGVVLETNFDGDGELSVIRLQTARNVFRGYGPEYVDVRLHPEAVTLAIVEGLEKEIQTLRRVLDSAVERLLERVR